MTKARPIFPIYLFLTAFLLSHVLFASSTLLPPPPTKPFADYAGIVSATAAQDINRILTDFERTSSCQVVVAVFKELPQGESLEDYANRIFNAWGIGQKSKNNGVLVLIFIKDRKIRIEVGYGLEGVLPDALAKRIISEKMAPRFRAGDYYGGIKGGVLGIIAAIGGEYKSSEKFPVFTFLHFLVFLFIAVMIILSILQNSNYVYTGSGIRRYRTGYYGGGFLRTGGWSGGYGGWSGGGGCSGGGGASGGW